MNFVLKFSITFLLILNKQIYSMTMRAIIIIILAFISIAFRSLEEQQKNLY